MNSQQYCNILQYFLLPKADRLFGENWTFQQDNSSVHSSSYTKQWMESNDIDLLDWPAKSPDLNIIENVWGQLARDVYADGKQYENVKDLENAIWVAWSKIEISYIRTLYRSLPNRLISVIERKGALTDY